MKDPWGPWGRTTWIGIALGVAASAVAHFLGVLDGYVPRAVLKWWPGLACFVIAGGTLGGLLGDTVGKRLGRRKRRRSHSRRAEKSAGSS